MISDMIREQDTGSTKTHKVVIQSAEIFVHERGQGQAVLYLHGSPDTHEMWMPTIEHIGGDVRNIAIDLPGFGQSTMRDDFSFTLDNMADAIRELVSKLEIEAPLILVTTDFGGHYGLAFTVKYPELVRGVAISNTNFFADYSWHIFAQMYRMPIIGEILLASATRSMMRQTLKGISPTMPDSYIDNSYDSGFGSASVRKTILKMYRSRSSKDFAGWEDKLLKILAEKPAIVLWGDKDPFITPEYAERFGNAEVHHFEEYSHWLPLESPVEYANILRSWLNTL